MFAEGITRCEYSFGEQNNLEEVVYPKSFEGYYFNIGQQTVKRVTFTDDEKKEVELCCPAKKVVDKVHVPAVITVEGEEYKVTSIGKNAFYKNTGVKELIVGNNIQSIENYAFYGCKNLKSIDFGNGIEIIGNSAFRKCTKVNYIGN